MERAGNLNAMAFLFFLAFFVILQRSVSINKNSCSVTYFVISVSKDLCNWKL